MFCYIVAWLYFISIPTWGDAPSRALGVGASLSNPGQSGTSSIGLIIEPSPDNRTHTSYYRISSWQEILIIPSPQDGPNRGPVP